MSSRSFIDWGCSHTMSPVAGALNIAIRDAVLANYLIPALKTANTADTFYRHTKIETERLEEVKLIRAQRRRPEFS